MLLALRNWWYSTVVIPASAFSFRTRAWSRSFTADRWRRSFRTYPWARRFTSDEWTRSYRTNPWSRSFKA